MRRVVRDSAVVATVIAAVAAMVYIDWSNYAVLQAIAMQFVFVGATHISRRILLPHIDCQEIAIQAVKEKNMPAAVVFLGVMIFLIVGMALPWIALR